MGLNGLGGKSREEGCNFFPTKTFSIEKNHHNISTCILALSIVNSTLGDIDYDSRVSRVPPKFEEWHKSAVADLEPATDDGANAPDHPEAVCEC